MSRQIFNKSANVDGIDFFYREAGDKSNPSILLLHGFPTSSVMFKRYELNCTYKSNIEMFPAFQEYFRTYQPPALIIWGKYEPYFNVNEAHWYKRDLPDAQIYIIDGSHMLLETHFDEVLNLIDNFLSLKV